MHLQFCCEGLVVVVVLFVCLGLLFLFPCFFRGEGLVSFPRWFWLLFFLSGRPSFVRFPNLPLVVGLWSATSLRSAKGRAVVVYPVFG